MERAAALAGEGLINEADALEMVAAIEAMKAGAREDTDRGGDLIDQANS